MAPTIDTTETAVPAAARPQTMAEKLAAQKAALEASKPKPQAVLALSHDADELCFSIRKEDLLRSVGPSSTAASEGVTLSVEGEFDYAVEGTVYRFKISMRGGWATVKMAN